MPVTFIHAADLHIDSPLKGLEAYEGAPLEQLRGATRAAFENLVSLAIERAVDFLIIAGDLFDGKWQDMQTGLWTAAQFRRLSQRGISVFVLQGNHDAASKVRQAVTWPSNVHVFSTDKPDTVVLEEIGVALHGQGFAQEKTLADLAADYPQPVDGLFNVGVLHTSLTGNPEHDTYAPTSLSVLKNRGYDYWALGHIHARSEPPLEKRPYIAYSGNLQGRHIKERGPKGCLMVRVDDGELTSVDFISTDTLRWELVEVNLAPSDGRVETLDAIERHLAVVHDRAEGRLVAVRLVLRGTCEAHRLLVDAAARAEIDAEIRNLANEMDGELWVEKIVCETTAPVDIDRLAEGKDLIGQLLQAMRRTVTDTDLLLEMAEQLKPLFDRAAVELGHAGLEIDNSAQLACWIRQAESLLVTRLTEDER